MSHFTIAIVLAIVAVSFLLGRLSVRVVRDRHLEGKRDELMAIKEGLMEVSDNLTRREEALRSKWQAMVVSASEICALANGSEGTWTPDDDRFLDSWSSAESVTKVEE